MDFIDAYYEFRKSVEFEKNGILPEMDHLIWCMLMGVPFVPADEEPSPEAALKAIDQRVVILKAVFVEVNRDQPEAFIDLGLDLYDRAGNLAKRLIEEGEAPRVE
jgi:hypothetical protein